MLAATGSPDVTLWGIHPATAILLTVCAFGLVLARRADEEPMWTPRKTEDTVEDEPDEEGSQASDRRLWTEFVLLATTVAGIGWLVGQSGLALAEGTGLSGSLVGGLFTSVITSLPELVTVLLTATLAAGMVGRERRHIGFEGVGILVFYSLGVVSLVALG